MIACLLPASRDVGERARRRALLLRLFAASAVWLGMVAFADSSVRAAERGESNTLYRRIYVPADDIKAWPRGGEKFLPIESRDFDNWLKAANAAGGEPPAARIQEARYWARLEGDRLVACRGQWTIAIRGDRPAFLPLSDMSLVVREARWQGAPRRPARIGVWGPSGSPADTRGLEVAIAGTLEFSWQARSTAIHNGLDIAWRLPAATTARLFLDLPEGKEPLVEGGVVLATHSSPPDAAPASANLQRWELALNPASATTLRLIEAKRASVDTAPTLTLREDVSYRITQRGLDMEATWRLDDSVQDRRVLAVPLPKDLHLVSVAVDNRELSWRIARGDPSDGEVAIIELPEATPRRPLQIIVRAWHPLFLDQDWQLPKLRPQDVFWQSGDVELSISPRLEMRALGPKDCVQTGVSPADDLATVPEITRLAMYSPAAEVSVTIARRQPQATIRLGSSLALTDPDVSGRLVTEWNVAEGSIHKFSGELAAGWVVEAVETTPAEALGEWFIDERGNRNHIEIQLARAVRPGRNVSVIISGRLQRAGIGEPISANALRMVNWADGHIDRHFLTFQTVEPYALETTGELPMVASEALQEDDVALVQQPFGTETIFDLARAGDGGGLKLSLERGQYEADIRLDAVYVRQHILQTYHLTIHPATNGVDRLLIYSTAALGDSLQWTDMSFNRPLSAERLRPNDPRRAGLPAAGELWLVRLPGPTTKTVEIAATFVTPWRARKQLPLLAMPEAVQQHGRVVVHAEMESMPVLEPHGMRSAPWPIAPAESSKTEGLPPVRAAYRYDPAGCLTDAGAAQLWMARSTARDTSPLVARHAELESFFWSNGRATHCATYDLENEGAVSFDLRMPPDAVMRAVVINGRTLQQPVGIRSDPLTTIPLPAGTRSATVSVYFETEQSALTAGSELQPPLIHHEIPVLSGRWTIWLSEQFSASAAEFLHAGGELNSRQRLFGPFGRPAQETPFHPLRPRDWNKLVSPLGSSPIGTSDAKTDLTGWAAYRTNFVADAPATVTVAHPPAMTAWAIAMFLICLVGGRWLRAHRGKLFITLLAFAAVVALFLPAVFVIVATGAVLGLLFSLIAVWPRRESIEIVPTHSWSRFSTVSVPSVIVALLLAKLALAEPAGEAASSPEAAQATTIERVLIPVDADGRQVGSKYYISEQFLRELLPIAGEESPANRQWVLHEAAYSGELRERAELPGIIADNWTLAFNIEVLARDTTVVLPLARREATWRDTAMLDGVPVPLVWRDEGSGCAIEISEPGRYQLTLSCVPRTTARNRHNSVTLTIPPLAGARLQLETPESLTGVSVSGEDMASAATGSPGMLERELDATDQLEVQWPPLSSAVGGAQSLRVTGMRWLQIGVDEVKLQAKYVVEGSARRPDALIVAFDRRWELEPDGSSPGESLVEDEPDGRRSVRVSLPPDEVDRQEIVLRWRLAGANSIGRLRLPPNDLVSIPMTHRWLAISSDPSLECEIIDGSASPGTVNEFLAMWGDADGAPQLVLGNLRTSVPWNVAVRPRLSESLIDEVLHVAAGRDTLRVAYQAEVDPGRTHEYHFPLIVPADLSIDEIALTASGRRIPVRWARVGETRVNVFLSEQMANEYRLVLHGTAPAEVDGSRALPRVTAVATSAASQSVHLYRDEEVLVEMTGLSEADELPEEPRNLPPLAWTARPVGVYRLDQDGFDQARLRITTNDVQITGPTLISLNRDADAWSAGIYGHWTVEQGRLDTLRLGGPAKWVGPFMIESSVSAAMEFDTAGKQGPTLLIRFPESIQKGGSVELSVRGLLAPAAQSPVSAPQITPEPMVRGKRYLLVPSHLKAEPITWNEAGVRPVELPDEFRAAPGIAKDALAFEIIDESFRMAVQPPAAVQQSARVRLADTTVWAAAASAQLIETRLVIAAPDLARCLLQLPREQELVSVRLDGHPAITQAVDARRWRVSLAPTQLPRMLEVVSVARATNNEHSKVQRPLLLAEGKPIPVEVSLWSIGHSAQVARPRIVGAATVAEAEQAALRLDRLVSIAEAATPAAVESPLPDGYHWFRPWADRLSVLREEAVEKMAGAAEPRSLSQVSRPAEEQLTRATERLDLWIEQCNELLAPPELEDEEAAVTSGNAAIAGPSDTSPVNHWTYCVAEGAGDDLIVDLAPAIIASKQSRVAGALAIVCAAAAGVWLMGRPAATDFLYRWPHAASFLIGLAFWAWLWPSWLGILIAVASLYLTWRIGWPGRSLPMERSTVLRVPRTEVAAP